MKSKLLLIALLIVSTATFAQTRKEKKANKDTVEWRYEIECSGIGSDGTYLVKVWSYSKKPEVAILQAKKNAVHGIIFKGFGGGPRECTSQKPLANNPNVEDEKADFFEKFFADGGDFMKYVTQSSDGSIDSRDRLKIGKEYKIGIILSVQKDKLRQDLEAAGIIRGLSSGF